MMAAEGTELGMSNKSEKKKNMKESQRNLELFVRTAMSEVGVKDPSENLGSHDDDMLEEPEFSSHKLLPW